MDAAAPESAASPPPAALPAPPSVRRTMRGPPDPPPGAPELGMSCRELLLFNTIKDFFGKPEHMQKLRQVLEEKSVSLRRLECIATASGTATEAVVSESYYAWLRAYGKRYFDPFARSKHIAFKPDGANKALETTLGQLNFLRWALTQPKLVDRAIQERNERVKRRPTKVGEAKGNVLSFGAYTTSVTL